jgi:hypothetical protein
MSLSKGKCWYSNNCLHFLKCAVPLSMARDRNIAHLRYLILKGVLCWNIISDTMFSSFWGAISIVVVSVFQKRVIKFFTGASEHGLLSSGQRPQTFPVGTGTEETGFGGTARPTSVADVQVRPSITRTFNVCVMSKLGNCDIRSYTNYSVLNEKKWNK